MTSFPSTYYMLRFAETYRRIASVDLKIPAKVSTEASDLITKVRSLISVVDVLEPTLSLAPSI